MTTTHEITADSITVTELCEAIQHARVAEKRLILRADAANLPAVKARIQHLITQYEALMDAGTGDTEQRIDNSYDPGDISHGFHVLPGGIYPNA